APTVTFTIPAARPQVPSARISKASPASSRSSPLSSLRIALNTRSGRVRAPPLSPRHHRGSPVDANRRLRVIFLGRFARWRGSFAVSRDLERSNWNERLLSCCPALGVLTHTGLARAGEPRTNRILFPAARHNERDPTGRTDSCR